MPILRKDISSISYVLLHVCMSSWANTKAPRMPGCMKLAYAGLCSGDDRLSSHIGGMCGVLPFSMRINEVRLKSVSRLGSRPTGALVGQSLPLLSCVCVFVDSLPCSLHSQKGPMLSRGQERLALPLLSLCTHGASTLQAALIEIQRLSSV